MVANCTGDQSFSQLKIIKSKLRITINEHRLNYLSILRIVCDVLDCKSFENIKSDISEKKSRKKKFNSL